MKMLILNSYITALNQLLCFETSRDLYFVTKCLLWIVCYDGKDKVSDPNQRVISLIEVGSLWMEIFNHIVGRPSEHLPGNTVSKGLLLTKLFPMVHLSVTKSHRLKTLWRQWNHAEIGWGRTVSHRLEDMYFFMFYIITFYLLLHI